VEVGPIRGTEPIPRFAQSIDLLVGFLILLGVSNTRPVPAFQEQLPLDERGEAALRKIVARSDAEHFGAGHSVKVRIRSSTILAMAIAHSHINHGACLSAEQYRNQIALFRVLDGYDQKHGLGPTARCARFGKPSSVGISA
jgi:predicted acyl esterase